MAHKQEGFTISVILGGLSVGVVRISGIINAHEAGLKKVPFVENVGLNLLLVMCLHFTTEHNHGHLEIATEKDPHRSEGSRSIPNY